MGSRLCVDLNACRIVAINSAVWYTKMYRQIHF